MFSEMLQIVATFLGPVGAIAGLILPPVVDFAKKKWLPAESDTPEATLSALATTNPEAMVKYVDAQAKIMEAQTTYFNRDVVGEPSRWVINCRAAIRPVTTALCCAVAAGDVVYSTFTQQPMNPAAAPAWVIVGNWFGTRLK